MPFTFNTEADFTNAVQAIIDGQSSQSDEPNTLVRRGGDGGDVKIKSIILPHPTENRKATLDADGLVVGEAPE